MFDYGCATDMSEPIPAALDAMAPGPELGAALATIDVRTVSGYDRVVILRAHERMASHHHAQIYAAMAAVAEAMEDLEECTDQTDAAEMAAAEIRTALRLTRRAADDELARALAPRRRFPRVWEALAIGAIDGRRAKTMLWGTIHLSDEAARRVVDSIRDRAGRLTTGQLAALIRKLSIEVDPQAAQRRYDRALSERRVASEATEDGTANLFGLELAPDRVAAATRRIDLLARTLKTEGETRTVDQLRATTIASPGPKAEPSE